MTQYVTSGAQPLPTNLTQAALTAAYPPATTPFGLIAVTTDQGPVWNRTDGWASMTTTGLLGQLLFNAAANSGYAGVMWGWV
jgi:hypothetical protein